MDYRRIYDVREAEALLGHEAELAFLGFALLWTIFWCVAYHCARRRGPQKAGDMRAGFFIGAFFILVGGWLALSKTLPAHREQRQCREWLRSGDVETAEGLIEHIDPATRYGGRRNRRAKLNRVSLTWKSVPGFLTRGASTAS
jgi:hypothetical protein